MFNVAFIIGTGPLGEDPLYLSPWVSRLSDKFNIYVITRIDPKIHYNDKFKSIVGMDEYNLLLDSINKIINIAKKVDFIYNSAHIYVSYSESELLKIQNEYGISINYLANLDYTYYRSKNNHQYIDKRIQLLCGLFNFFKEYYTKNKIDAIVNTMEDDIISLSAMYVAKTMGIRIIGFSSGRFPKRGISFFENFNRPMIWNCKNNTDISEIRALYNKETLSGINVINSNKNRWNVGSFPKKISSVRRMSLYDEHLSFVSEKYPLEKYIFYNYNQNNFLNGIKQHIVQTVRMYTNKLILINSRLSTDEHFFLYPMHYFDDAQITVREPFVDQADLVKKISKALPHGYFLFVKPHPHYFGTDMNIGDVNSIKKLSNVIILPTTSLPYDYIKKSVGVITLNSTLGWESIIVGKPVICLGHDFYSHGDYCHVVRDLNDLPEVMIKVIKEQGIDKTQNVEQYIKTLYDNTIWINGFDYPHGSYGLTEVDGIAIAKAFEQLKEFN